MFKKISSIYIILQLLTTLVWAGPLVYKFSIKEEINPSAWRITRQAMKEARELKADYILLHLNTYGGMVDMADSIRTALLESKIKTIVFIDNNAASAGALISIACDRIYMRSGASIGAASVVNQTGEVMPEKYQSYMRSLMRATAEANGRDPRIAEGFVDADLIIDSLKPKGKVLTFTTVEALKYGFCDNTAETIDEVLEKEKISGYVLKEFEVTILDRMIGFLTHPAVNGVLILLIIGGLYFELQAPGIGLPLVVSITAALLYFAPLYLEGLAANWEILLFVAGIILLIVEIFAIPGFGFIGITGIVFIVCGLAFSLVRNDLFDFSNSGSTSLVTAFGIVLLSLVLSIVISVMLGANLLKSHAFQRLVLNDEQRSSDGYQVASLSIDLTGKKGKSITVLRPSGKVEIEGERFDAVSEMGMIDVNKEVVVISHSTTSIVVRES